MLTRLLALAFAALAFAPLVLAPLSPGARADVAETGAFGGGPGLDSLTEFGLPQPNAFEFRPRRIVVVTNKGALSAPVPNRVGQYSTNRLDLSDTPLIGELFDPRPGTRLVTRENLWGEAFRDGDALIINIPEAPFVLAERSQISVLRRNRQSGVRELMFQPALTPQAYPGANGMTKLGDVYVEGSRIVIRPERVDVHRNLGDGALF